MPHHPRKRFGMPHHPRKRFGMPHHPRKRFGQHFLRDIGVLNQLQQAIHAQPTQHLVEIGPGEGVLTNLLLPHVKRCDLIEIDCDLAKQLAQHFPQAILHNVDVLKFDFSSLGKNLRLVGNLPYNISSPLLFHLFNHIELIEDMHFMLQKEVVLRMTANVGDKNYNRLSVMTQYFCTNELLFEIKPEAFYPPPKVDSAVVRLHPHKTKILAKDTELLSQVVLTAFTQRRKTLRNCLKSLIDDTQLKQLGIDPEQRPQQLSVNHFVMISNFLYDERTREEST